MSRKCSCLSRLVLGVASLVAVGACNRDGTTEPLDDNEPGTLITTLLVSTPSRVGNVGHLQLSAGASVEDSYTYVSASPGSAPGVTASITNRTRDHRSGITLKVEASIHDGGFDPVSIAASSGDTLRIEFLSPNRSPLLVGAAVVPRFRAPTIVRTNPRSGKKDVPLNARFEIVFSDPIDPSTITAKNIEVLAKGARVAGSLNRRNEFTVEFTPAAPLTPNTSVDVVVRRDVRNVNGVGLEDEFFLDFETATASNTSTVACSADTECLAFVRDDGVYTTVFSGADIRSGSPDKSPVATRLSLTSQGGEPVWSPDGRKLAFRNWWRNELCLANADDFAQRCLGIFVDGRPSWSPDGSELAFVGSFSPDNPARPIARKLFALKSADMSVRVILDDVGTFCGTGVSWSPDGRRIAFTSLPSMCGGLATIRPDGSDLKLVVPRDAERPINSIAWAPDGQSFAILAGGLLGTLSVQGTGWQALDSSYWGESPRPGGSSIPEIFGNPTWTLDGRYILYGAGWNCFMGCTDNRILFVKPDGSERGTVLLNATEPSVRPRLP
ncbi:MAG TPA: Ig-like domain-containing protein [Gemmatimonadaceae bacterium]|nr:Ig-like domain-containing protein [Gemmatimonadaceae bacterium]